MCLAAVAIVTVVLFLAKPVAPPVRPRGEVHKNRTNLFQGIKFLSIRVSIHSVSPMDKLLTWNLIARGYLLGKLSVLLFSLRDL